MTAKERAEAIADKANDCCGRSDGYEEEIAALVLSHIEAAVLEERAACAEIADKFYDPSNFDTFDEDSSARGAGCMDACAEIAHAIRKRSDS